MTDLTRLAARIVEQLGPGRSAGPVSLAELMNTVVPYRTSRRPLELASLEDYETLLLRLVAGEEGFARADEVARARARQELATPHPDLGVLQELATAALTLDLTRVAAAATGEAAAPPPPPPVAPALPPEAPEAAEASTAPWPDGLAPEPEPAAEPPAPPDEGAAISLDEIREMLVPEPPAPPAPGPLPAAPRCSLCGGALPLGRAINFCPHCGGPQHVTHCPDCGTELELGWKHCVECGRRLDA